MAKESGKREPNVFIKGMNMDSIESFQPKDTYRFAKNARLTGYTQSSGSDMFAIPSAEGGMVSGLSPYPSDRMALNLNMLIAYSDAVHSLGNYEAWEINEAIYLLTGQAVPFWVGFQQEDAFLEGTIRIKLYNSNGDGNAPDLADGDENYFLIEQNINEQYFQQYFGNVTDTNDVICGMINNDASHPFQAYVRHTVPVEQWNTNTDSVVWIMLNYIDPENVITGMEVTLNGVTVSSSDQVNEITFLDYKVQTFGQAFPVINLQVLGQYSFSDYMVLLGTVQTGEFNQTELEDAFADINIDIVQVVWEILDGTDFVMKVKQEPDGQLYSFTESTVFNTSSNAMSALFYFFGELGFSEKQKLKVVGSEENDKIKRIYFTDGTFPLRTMNVEKEATFYNQYNASPNYFNLFPEVKFAPVEITNYFKGGKLSNKSHAFCYRYVSGDGRLSQISPMSNPCSVPGNADSGFNQMGGNPSESSGKMISGRMDNLDHRYERVEMIHTEYLNGIPDSFSTIFGTFPIKREGDNCYCTWRRTGFEAEIETISISDISNNTISWDTCQALETKDNRLFCGNLNNTTVSVDTDFRLFSYNAYNQTHHNYPDGNPHLYSDWMYDHGIQDTDNGGYSNWAKGVFRYIKGNWEDYWDNPEFNDNSSSANNFSAYSYQQEEGDDTYLDGEQSIFGAQSKHFSTPLPEGHPDAGEYEGVRVTFRILETAPEKMNIGGQDASLVLDSESLKPVSDNPIAKGQYSNFNGKPMDYTNPVYNSHFVGYRRDEIYRFGIVFYDKKGNPMFVKKLGDIRFPTHSCPYYEPNYTSDHADNNGTGISSATQKWPYYFQTSRHEDDQGLLNNITSDNFILQNEPVSPSGYIPALGGEDGANGPSADMIGQTQIDGADGFGLYGPYNQSVDGDGNVIRGDNYKYKKSGLRGCVLYPYFEVKLSSTTTSKIGGYAIVRVGRDEENKTVLFTGVLDRANLYSNYTSDNPGTADMAHVKALRNDLGTNCFPLMTNLHQQGRDAEEVSEEMSGAGNHHGAIFDGGWDGGTGSVYTIDSPDLNLLSESYTHLQSDRFQIIESLFCYKNRNPISGFSLDNSTLTYMQTFMDRGGQEAGREPGLFAGIIAKKSLEGGSYWDDELGENVEAGSWGFNIEPLMSNIAGDGTGDFIPLSVTNLGLTEGSVTWLEEDNNTEGDFPYDTMRGFYTKYYSKRHPAYPLHRLLRHRFLNQGRFGQDYINNIPGIPRNTAPFNPGTTFTPAYTSAPDYLYNNGANNYAADYFQNLYNPNAYFSDNFYETGPLIGLPINATDYDGGQLSEEEQGDLWWRTPTIQGIKLLDCGERFSEDEQGPNKGKPFFNMGMYRPIHASESQWDKRIGPNTFNEDSSHRVVCFQGGTRTLALTTNYHAGALMLPSIRGFANHPDENIAGRHMGRDGARNFSPEMNLVSIKRNKSQDVMYGGNTEEDFSYNRFMSTGHYRSTDSFTSIENIQPTIHTGNWIRSWDNNATGPPNEVFGGDTYVCLYEKKKSMKPNNDLFDYELTNQQNVMGDKDEAMAFAYTAPMECNMNLDLRQGKWVNSSTAVIPKYVDDDNVISKSYMAAKEQSILYAAEPWNWEEAESFPATVAWSEVKLGGDILDAYSIFPYLNRKELEYEKGPITQLFTVFDRLISLQHKGTALLSTNPRTIVQTEDGKPINIGGSPDALERFDYINEHYGSQHFHGSVVTPNGAYYYDDANCKFLQLRPSEGGNLTTISLGETKGVQSFFQHYKSRVVNDRPLHHDSNIYGSGSGGISIGHDPEFNEILFTIKPETAFARTIVFNEAYDLFTTFLSKTACFYFNHGGRMYCTYDNVTREFPWDLLDDTDYEAYANVDFDPNEDDSAEAGGQPVLGGGVAPPDNNGGARHGRPARPSILDWTPEPNLGKPIDGRPSSTNTSGSSRPDIIIQPPTLARSYVIPTGNGGGVIPDPPANDDPPGPIVDPIPDPPVTDGSGEVGGDVPGAGGGGGVSDIIPPGDTTDGGAGETAGQDLTDDDGPDYDGPGCTDSTACNYNPYATADDMSCVYPNECGWCDGYDYGEFWCYGCDDPAATNYCASCTYSCQEYVDLYGGDVTDCCLYEPAWGETGCGDPQAFNYCEDCVYFDNEMCVYQEAVDQEIYGCMNPAYVEYDELATVDNGSCETEWVGGCTEYLCPPFDYMDPVSGTTYPVQNPTANYDPLANTPCNTSGLPGAVGYDPELDNECCICDQDSLIDYFDCLNGDCDGDGAIDDEFIEDEPHGVWVDETVDDDWTITDVPDGSEWEVPFTDIPLTPEDVFDGYGGDPDIYDNIDNIEGGDGYAGTESPFAATGLDQIWLANGYENSGLTALGAFNMGIQKYLQFGGMNYYWYEPFEIEFVINDEPYTSKIFDSISINMQEESEMLTQYNLWDNSYEYGFNRFTKFVFKGDSTAEKQYQMGQVYEGEWYENWGYYKVREGSHHVPVRAAGFVDNQYGLGLAIGGGVTRVRGKFAKIKMAMQYGYNDAGGESLMSPLTSEHQEMAKNFSYSIFSIVPKYRYSRI